ncbi:MAG: ABC transporter ATP-binding protein [Geminicoccaceae bacterium]|nr:MAG: ABC transporter ATP-binding protein [Geminicoccaceae bacterium]
MQGLRIEGLSKAFGEVRAVDAVDLALPQGQFVCFLGPSGCGKTTLLRMIAGLETPTGGRLLLHGRDITEVPVHRRRFGMVFQSLALFPHLSVAGNIGYALKLRGLHPRDRAARVEELLQLVRLPGLGDRHIDALSGGQRQRVAIARALAQEPSLMLLDEPLSALDAKLREAMQIELRQLQQQLKITTILVTHDQREAMTMADLIVVMADGKVQQVGSPLEVYEKPANRFVADFIGLNNLLPAAAVEPGAVRVGNRLLPVAEVPAGIGWGSAVTLSVRPENVRLKRANGHDHAGLTGEVVFVRDVGNAVETHVRCGESTVIAVFPPRDGIQVRPGDQVDLDLDRRHCRVLVQ